jgi:molybdate transport system regulatory protein
MAKKVKQIEVSGSFSFKKTDIEFLGSDRIALLEKIDECGSITKAAKAVGICYKTAWDTIDAINNLSDKPLFVRMTGGKSGGGTVLTEEGREVIRKYKIIQEEHEKFLSNLEDKMGNAENLYRFLKRISMKVSARNIYSGKVVKIVKGAVNSEVILALKGGDSIVSIITNESVETLGLREGSDAYAIIKASSVLIGADLNGTKISTRNILCGKITNFTRGAVNSELSLEFSGGNTISAVITNESAIELGLSEGSQANAIFKASDVILGIS